MTFLLERWPVVQLHPRVRVLGGWRAIAVLTLLVLPGTAEGQTATQTPSVVMLFSLRSTAPSVATVETAFRRALESGIGSPVDLRVEYLDLPDATAVPYARRLSDLLIDKYAGHRVDVVVVQRSEALGFLLQNRETLFPGVPIVFTDVTPDDLQRLKPPPDVTGAVRIVEGQRTVSLALDLRPDTRQVVIVSGASPFDRGAAMFARGLVEARAKGLTVLSLDGLPLEEQLRRVADAAGGQRRDLHQLPRRHLGPLDGGS